MTLVLTPSVASARVLALTRDFVTGFGATDAALGCAGVLPEAGTLHSTRFFAVGFFGAGFFAPATVAGATEAAGFAGVCADAAEYRDEPAVAILLGPLPAGAIQPFGAVWQDALQTLDQLTEIGRAHV